MSEHVRFFVPGIVVAQGRPRAFAVNGRVIMTDPPKSRDWKQAFREVASQHVLPDMPWEGPLRMSVSFFLPRPKSVSANRRPYPIVKPDLDNLLKAVKDALSGVFYKDDRQVVEYSKVEKAYDDAHMAGVEVVIGRM